MKKTLITFTVILVSGSSIVGASASTLTPSQITYNKTMSIAKANYLKSVNVAQDLVIKAGAVAEVARRAKVGKALSLYQKVIVKAKAPVLAAEAKFSAALKASSLSPNDAALKQAKVNARTALTIATANLKRDRAVSVALRIFNTTRRKAMSDFKASLANVLRNRVKVKAAALAKYKAINVKATLILKSKK